MSSAAKLRKYGRGTAVVATAALVMTSFGPAAFAAWDVAGPGQPGSANNPLANVESIGIVDTDTGANNAPAGNNGATLVQAGQNGQAIADVRLVIPNRFVSGDRIDLRLFDRSASENNTAGTNSDAAHLLGFSGVPTSVEVSEPMRKGTRVHPDTESTDPFNTETLPTTPWQAPSSVITPTPPEQIKPAQAPQFAASLLKTEGNQGNDTLRLEVNGVRAAGDPDAVWVVTLKGMKVDVGAQVTPGMLRVVPFATNQGAQYTPSDWFYGNQERAQGPDGRWGTSDDLARDINIYTVPAFVSPVTVAVDNANITSDDTAQSVGDIKITETHAGSIGGSATYTVTVDGARIANPAQVLQSGKITVTDGGASETATITNVTADTISFTVQNADDARRSTFAISGVLLSAATPGRISFEVDGGRIATFMRTPDDSGAVTGIAGVPTEAAFAAVGSTTGNNSFDIATGDQVGQLTGAAASAVLTGFGSLGAGAYTVERLSNTSWEIQNAAGDTFATGTGSAATAASPTSFALVSTVGDAVGSNATVTFSSPVADGTTFVVNAPALNDVTVADAGTGTAVAMTGNFQLGDGLYTLTQDGSTTGYYLADADSDRVTENVTIANLAAAGNSITFPLLDPMDGSVTLTNSGGVAPSVTGGTETTVTVTNSALASVTQPGVSAPALTGASAVVTDPALADAEYEVTYAGGTYSLTPVAGGGAAIATSTNGLTFTGTGVSVEFASLPAVGTVLTLVEGVTTTDPGVNQDDIVAPTDQLLATGTASAGETAIGGTDRFGTARKIAKAYSAFGDTAIIVNGMNFPDALSSGFLSQREGAPILLSAQNFVPQDTLESLKERGVRKVYIVGGEAAVGSKVVDTLKATDAYGYDDAANVLKPRGSKLEVIQLGGSDRYVTNWVVNTYAAAQTANASPVGKINVAYGQSQKTTALVARGDQFADALTANLLTAGLPGGLTPYQAGQAGSTSFTRVPAAGTLSQADLDRIVQTGNYFVTDDEVTATDTAVASDRAGATVNGLFLRSGSATGTIVATSTDGVSWTPVSGPTVTQPGTSGAGVATNVNASAITPGAALVFSAAQADGSNFSVAYTAPVGGRYEYDRSAPRRNALPVILTPGNGLHSYSKNQLNALHIQHALLIGGDAALSKQVNDDIAAAGTTSYRLGGTDRFHTAQLVNMFAMADETPKADNPQYVPGLGFDGGMYYNADGTPFSGTIPVGEATPEWVAYLANGLKFPDALVSGPWISRSRDQLLMTTGTDLTNPSRGFLTDNAEDIDRAAGLGLGNAVSSSVINEANKIASSK